MNNNRGNNRRRGRGNNRPQGGGQQLNRIDSRARGNAPQLLEKYRKLAQDAHLNGDRVQAEYYLQFADHYFRVIADTRLRQDEQRARQNGGSGTADRWQEGEDEGLDFGMDTDFPAFDRPAPRREEREPREPRGENQREGRERKRFEPRDESGTEDSGLGFEGVRADEGEPASDIAENPFVRDNRAARGLRPRSERPERGADRGERTDRGERGERRPRRERDDAPVALDPAILPPAIGTRPDVDEPATSAAEDAPAPKRRGRPRKNPLPEATETVEG